jgi:hypothetical protein
MYQHMEAKGHILNKFMIHSLKGQYKAYALKDK